MAARGRLQNRVLKTQKGVGLFALPVFLTSCFLDFLFPVSSAATSTWFWFRRLKSDPIQKGYKVYTQRDTPTGTRPQGHAHRDTPTGTRPQGHAHMNTPT
ncbi:hypothetical protein EYF80_065882 [Liparis tanakae]|uniref:Uncharacterized protein n=1 Tax=Liparis tanakae TaxID=230148 RepID=A0A4Z2E5F1_9TELE|nr:hypothetical protein EYF80_065882 [Liparis tanakae]